MSDAACNDNHEPENGDISRAASDWLVRLEDAPDDVPLQSAFEVWLAADTRHAAAWDETLVTARLIAMGRPNLETNVFYVAARQQRTKVHRQRFPWIGAAAAACALWVAAPVLVTHWQADETTGTSEVRTVRLADGSRVVLAPGSAVAVDFRPETRNLRLLRGEAWFDVAHDANRPFRVLAGASETRVLGTAFDVRLTDQGAGVAVVRGIVEVSLSNGETPVRQRLTKGQSLNFDWNGATALNAIRADRIASWRQGRAIVNDRPVIEVINALRPWYGGYIIAGGPDLQRLRVTGLYDLRDPDAALAALGRAHNLYVRKLTPWLRIVTLR